MLTTVLELVGLALLIAAAYLSLGPAFSLFVGGACCLWASWSLTREGRR